MARRRVFALTAVLLGLLAACGGGAGGADDTVRGALQPVPPPAPVELILISDGNLDGITIDPGGFAGRTGALTVGDFSDNTWAQAYVVFQRPDLPPNAEIRSAILDVYQYEITGAPYPTLGNLVVDEVDLGGGLASARIYTVRQSAFATLSTTPVVESKRVDVTPQFAAFLAEPAATQRPRLELRVRFEQTTDGDRAFDFVRLSDGFDTPGVRNPARIFLTYATP